MYSIKACQDSGWQVLYQKLGKLWIYIWPDQLTRLKEETFTNIILIRLDPVYNGLDPEEVKHLNSQVLDPAPDVG